MTPVRTQRRRLVAALGLSLVAAPAMAQIFPSRPLKLVIPFPPGGSTDLAGRLLAEEMGKALGQPVVVENRAGAAGALGVASVLRSPPDGYTLVFSGAGPTVIGHLIGQSMGFTEREIGLVGSVCTLELVFVGRPGLAASTLSDVIRTAKASPGQLTYASAGYGGPVHLAYEYLRAMAGIDIRHIPYKGDAPATADLMGGQVDLGMLSAPAAIPLLKAGKLKALAVGGKTRLKQLPDLPTASESGLPGYEVATWNVLAAPVGLPRDIRERLHGALQTALNIPRLRERLEEQGMTPLPGSLADAEAFVAAERAKWAKVTAIPGIQLKE